MAPVNGRLITAIIINYAFTRSGVCRAFGASDVRETEKKNEQKEGRRFFGACEKKNIKYSRICKHIVFFPGRRRFCGAKRKRDAPYNDLWWRRAPNGYNNKARVIRREKKTYCRVRIGNPHEHADRVQIVQKQRVIIGRTPRLRRYTPLKTCAHKNHVWSAENRNAKWRPDNIRPRGRRFRRATLALNISRVRWMGNACLYIEKRGNAL